MKPEYYDIYRRLYDLYMRDALLFPPIRPFPPSEQVKLIDDAITKAISDNNLKLELRPDARFFLLVNFHLMVVLPLYANPNRPIALPKLKEILDSDVSTILNETSKNLSNDREISGHEVLNTVSNIWKSLKATELQVWG